MKFPRKHGEVKIESWRSPWRWVNCVLDGKATQKPETDADSLTTLRRPGQIPVSWFSNANNNYKCESCGKNYKWKGSLRNHKRLECGKEPQFQCHICPHRTYQKGNLVRHLALFHKIK